MSLNEIVLLSAYAIGAFLTFSLGLSMRSKDKDDTPVFGCIFIWILIASVWPAVAVAKFFYDGYEASK